MILVTGANGFVGGAVLRSLLAADVPVSAAVRQLDGRIDIQGVSWHAVGSIDAQTNWLSALNGVQTVVHSAGRTHIMNEVEVDALAAYREVNVYGTLRLAEQAAIAGVKRLVFLSSVKVNGESTLVNQKFSEADNPAPEDAIGQSKLEAEQALLNYSLQTGMEVVIIRAPLVYGPGVKGNFASMIKAILSGLPLPLGGVNNQRSMVALDNLVSMVLLCADYKQTPQAANQVFMVADGEDVSVSTLLRKLAFAAKLPSHLFTVPVSLIRLGGQLLGKEAVIERLLGNLQVDANKAQTLLGWRPVRTMEEQLCKIFEARNSR
jgi:nucleoside-diphosphate-sugar epimerase